LPSVCVTTGCVASRPAHRVREKRERSEREKKNHIKNNFLFSSFLLISPSFLLSFLYLSFVIYSFFFYYSLVLFLLDATSSSRLFYMADTRQVSFFCVQDFFRILSEIFRGSPRALPGISKRYHRIKSF